MPDTPLAKDTNERVQDVQAKVEPPLQPSLPPDTTKQQDQMVEGQRRINFIWEVTQAIIAVTVICGLVALSAYSFIIGKPEMKVPESLTNAAFLIVGFYFSRTNHQAIGGIGNKPVERYVGR